MGLLLLNGESGLNPRTLFANGEQGLWLDPSQMSTLYQDSNGVTPCTAAGDPVGLILDQSRGGLSQIGADLVTNGTFAADTDWTKGANWTIGSGVATKTGGAANNLTQTISSTAGAWYRISLDVTRSAGTLTVSLGTSGTTYAITATGSYTFFILAGSGTQTLTLAGDSSFAGTVDNVVVRSVPGNHAYQSSSSARPTLARIPSSGRRNLLTRTEEFDNAAWTKYRVTATANQTTAPDGTTTADKLIETAATDTHFTQQNVTVTSGVAYTLTAYAKASERNFFVLGEAGGGARTATFDLSNGTVGNIGAGVSASIASVGSGWYRCSVVYTTASTTYSVLLGIRSASGAFVDTYLGDGTSGIFIWGAQLELGSTATNYQKVGSTHDVTESGFNDLWHLSFDGSDDSLVTNAVDFSGTDEMTVIAGVRKLSDATAIITELTANLNTNNGGFYLVGGPLTGSGGNYAAASKGTTLQNFDSPTSYVAPTSNVVSVSADISGDTVAMRVNGLSANSNLNDQGSGNYSNAIIYIGRRGGTTLPFNGHIYQLIIRGRTTPTGKLLEAERFAGKKTGIFTI